MTVDHGIIAGLKRARLTIAKMQARQQLLQNQIEDIKTDTELLLGPFSAEAEQIIEGGEKVRKNQQEVIDSIQSWHDDMQQIVNAMLVEQDPVPNEFIEIHEAIATFVSRSGKYEEDSLVEMTEIVRLITQANADLRRAATEDTE